MTLQDVPEAVLVTRDAFDDYGRRRGCEDSWGADLEARYPRFHHLLGTDPGGAWVAEEDGALRAVALALVRERLWGLSLLAVSPSHQSAGLGGSLLEKALGHGAAAPAGLILSSADPRALRIYSRAGFDLRPAVDAVGRVKRRPAAEPAVREARWPEDRDLVEAAGRFVRGAGHGADAPAWLESGLRLWIHEHGGFAAQDGDGAVKVLAALHPELAAGLLRTLLREVPSGAEARLEFISAGQEWAVATAHEAGLELRPAGAVMTRGSVGPLAPYLPNGSYL